MARREKNIRISQDDLDLIDLNAGRGAHRIMMENSSVKGGARKSKKAYDRKRNARKDWQ